MSALGRDGNHSVGERHAEKESLTKCFLCDNQNTSPARMNWSIVIPTWQRAELLRKLLCALGKQSVREFEVIIVCDGEDPGTRELSGGHDCTFPARWIFHAENQGLAAARNTGASAARGDYLLFLDDDVLPSTDLISRHEEAHSAAPDWPATAVCGRIAEDREAAFRSKTDEFMQQAWEKSLQTALPKGESRTLLTVGAEAESSAWFGLNCSIRRSLFEEFGGFDPKMRSDEEMEFGFRLYRRGVLTRYAANAIVRHWGSKDMSEYYPRCWRLSGGLDVYRATERQQRCVQNSQLTELSRGKSAQRAMVNVAWQSPSVVLRAAKIAEKITNIAGSRTAFGAWTRLRHSGEYWSGVRATGISRDKLVEIAGPTRPILMFHSISAPQDSREATYYTSPRRFRRILSWLRMRKYVHVGATEWLGEQIPKQGLLLTFDDAYDDLYTELLPVVGEFKLKPLVFVVANRIGKTNDWDKPQGLRTRSLLTSSQMREMQQQGVTFGSHSATHPLLTSLSNGTLIQEVRDSKLKLEDMLGNAVEWFSYPFGDVDRRVRAAVLEAGYKAAVTTNAGFNRWQDPLALNRFEIDDRDWLVDGALRLATGRSYRKGILARLRKR
jgi:GT2 family glycosyltransferase/peptidoglycan/xylan/chitin deacetylase (PgdA/CDA1 family)